MTGKKTFLYQIQPKEPGTYNLADYFNWTFFNPGTGRYEQLTSDLTITVTGQSKQRNVVPTQIPSDDFYAGMEARSNELRPLGQDKWFVRLVNAGLLLMAVATVWVLARSKQG